MQRSIKFRAWGNETSTMYSWNVMKDSFKNCGFDDTSNFLSVMQYTGLKDKNGKEIYEGDFLSVDWHDKRYPVHTIGPVEWDEKEACWQLGEGGRAYDDAKSAMEVIGNIYENPDLLNSLTHQEEGKL